jgi:pimeloyl-ACP methyl ester carboxylesterase
MVIAVPVAIGVGWQALAERDLRARFPPPGELVRLADGRQIHLRQWGVGNPGPTILLDTAASTPSSAWALFAQELARDHHVVAYDRPGMGWSTGLPGPRDAQTAAAALREALVVANVAPPYVVVAHSYGGFSGRLFSHLNRSDVVALVLMDTTHEDGGGERGFALWYRLAAWRNHLGLNQLVPPGNGFAGLPSADAEAAHAVSQWTSHADATADELDAWHISAAQLQAAGDLGDLPLLVIAAIGGDEHTTLQRDLARLSTQSTYRPLEIWHTSMLFNPDHARIVADEIRRFLHGVR